MNDQVMFLLAISIFPVLYNTCHAVHFYPMNSGKYTTTDQVLKLTVQSLIECATSCYNKKCRKIDYYGNDVPCVLLVPETLESSSLEESSTLTKDTSDSTQTSDSMMQKESTKTRSKRALLPSEKTSKPSTSPSTTFFKGHSNKYATSSTTSTSSQLESESTSKRFSPTTTPSCRLGWSKTGDICVLLSEVRKTWNGAKEECLKMGGNLAHPDIKATDDHLKTIMSSKATDFWIGGIDEQGSGTWIWEATGVNVLEGYTNITSGGSTSSVTCYVMAQASSWAWRAIPCTETKGYVCETVIEF